MDVADTRGAEDAYVDDNVDDNVDDTPFDKEDDARLIYMEMYGLRTKYHIIGTCLGISPDKLEEIRCRFPETQANHAANALSEMLLAWLRQSNTSGPFGAPSWKAVVKVVAHDAGGGNVLLAREIAKNHRKKLAMNHVEIFDCVVPKSKRPRIEDSKLSTMNDLETFVEPKPCSCETLEDHIILGKCDVIAPKRLITNRDTTELQLVLARQQKEIVREFISLREDTFTQLNDRCNFDETKIHILRVLTKDTDRFRGITNWSDFEFELFNKFCSWFNFEIIEYIRSHDKILQLNPNSDKHMLDYKRKFYLFCRRRCFYVGGTLHNGQLLGPRLTFKVHECYKKYVLNDVIAIKMIIYETLNLKSYQIYVDTVTEGCVQVTCSIAPCCTIPTKLSQHQITQLQKHKIFSLKINEEELMDTLEKDVDFLNLSDTEEYIHPKEEKTVSVDKLMDKGTMLKYLILNGIIIGLGRTGKSCLMNRLLNRRPSFVSPRICGAERTLLVSKRYSNPLFVADAENPLKYKPFDVMENQESTPSSSTHAAQKVVFSEQVSKKEAYVDNPQIFEPGSTLGRQLFPSKLKFLTPTVAVFSALAEGSVPEDLITSPTQEDAQGGNRANISSKRSLAGDETQESSADQSLIKRSLPLPFHSVAETFEGVQKKKGILALEDSCALLHLMTAKGHMGIREVLHLFVSGPSIFFYTFRLDRDLNEPCVTDSGGTKSSSVVELLLQTLVSVFAMDMYPSRNVHEQTSPKIIIIGTHKDRLDYELADNHIKTVDKQLQQLIKSSFHLRRVESMFEYACPSRSQLIYAVDNFSESDSEFKNICSAVQRIFDRGIFEMGLPSHWILFGLILKRCMKPIISYEHCYKLATECGFTTQGEVNEALHFFHSKVGLIRYFPHEGRENFVITDPQVLLDAISELIIEGTCKNDLRQKGIFSASEFKVINQSECEIPITYVREILEDLRVIAPFKMDGEIKYFVPCVLAHTNKLEDDNQNDSLLIPPLIIAFSCSYCPIGVTAALINFLLNNEMNSFMGWVLLTESISRDAISFQVGPLDTVTIKAFPSHLEVNCIRTSQFTEYSDKWPQEEICNEVAKSIDNGIQQILIDLNYTRTIHSLSFICRASGCKGGHPAQILAVNGAPSMLLCSLVGQKFRMPDNAHMWNIQTFINEELVEKDHDETYLCDEHLSSLLKQLNEHSAKWRNIGTYLGFCQGELDTIQASRVLLLDSPNSWLRVMLLKWLQRPLGHSQGSTSLASLKDALSKAGLGKTARGLCVSSYAYQQSSL